MEVLRERAAAAQLNEIERYRLLLHMLRTVSQSFEVHLSEGDFDFHASQMEWMPQMREKLIDSIRRQENNQHIESLILVAADYILEHLTENELKTEDAADSISMSRSYFSTSFKKYTGFSVNGFIRKERVELAKKMIRENYSLSFSEVSYQVGYRDEKYLQRYSSSGKALHFLSIRGRFLINNVLGILYSILPGNNKQGYYVTVLQRRLFAVERTNVSVLYICSVF